MAVKLLLGVMNYLRISSDKVYEWEFYLFCVTPITPKK